MIQRRLYSKRSLKVCVSSNVNSNTTSLHPPISEFFDGKDALQESMADKGWYLEKIAPDTVEGLTAVVFAVIIGDVDVLQVHWYLIGRWAWLNLTFVHVVFSFSPLFSVNTIGSLGHGW